MIIDYNLNDSLIKTLFISGWVCKKKTPKKPNHLLTISNTAQGPFHIAPAVWHEGENEGRNVVKIQSRIYGE